MADNTIDAKVGMNNDNFDEVLFNLNNDIDDIISSLHDIDNKFSSISEYFTGSVADEFQTKYAALSKEYTTIKDNLNTYINDLLIIKKTYGEADIRTGLVAQDYTSETGQKVKEAEEENEVIDKRVKASQTLVDETKYTA